MAGHTSEKRWVDTTAGGITYKGISNIASDAVTSLIIKLLEIEEAYQQMQEIYLYAGGSASGLAAQLFKEDIEARRQNGVSAVVTVDIVSPGVLGAVSVASPGGTGYEDKLGYIVGVNTNGGVGGEIKYDVVDGSIVNARISKPGAGYELGTGVEVSEFPSAGSVPGTTVSQEEIDKATDLINAMTAAHQIYQAANNVAVTQEDRLTEMRRMV